MITSKELDNQMKRIHFNRLGWGRGEVNELTHILLPDEEIFECVNGIYEGGFALLLASDVRVLLVDKKPLNYLTVEDLRFDMINELDYSHRLLGANISISAGNKNLKFRSYNQPRLRKLITHVQHCMADSKKKQSYHQEGQEQHLGQINQQLQTYLVAQYQQQQTMHDQLQAARGNPAVIDLTPPPPPLQPSPELADYLFAQGLLVQHEQQQATTLPQALPQPALLKPSNQMADIYRDGMQEVFGKQTTTAHSFEINPLRVAYSKLPQVLRSRKFGRPSLHVHNSAPPIQVKPEPVF